MLYHLDLGFQELQLLEYQGAKTKEIFIKPMAVYLKRLATLKKIINKTNELIDEGIVIWFKGPNSYTGEDMVEFHTHGSKAVVEEILKCLEKFDGCRLAEPGEFTKLAFQNNKINLLKAESIGDLIASETELQRKQH